MADQRTRRQKLQAMADDKGASKGERDNARSLLAKMKPEAQPLRAAAPGTSYSCPHGVRIVENGHLCFICNPYRPPTGPEARPAGSSQASSDFWFRDFFNRFEEAEAERADEWKREALRQAQAREGLRRRGFALPGNGSFETEFAFRATNAADGAFTRASTDANDASAHEERERIRDMLSKMSVSELHQFVKKKYSKED